MGIQYIKVFKNDHKFIAELIFDADNSAAFVPLEIFLSTRGEPDDRHPRFLLISWSESEIYRQHPDYSERAYEVDQGVMIPIEWEQYPIIVQMDESYYE